jgi:hypothetical protein
MTSISVHTLSSTELGHRYKSAVEPIAKSHFHALWLLSQGYSIDETVEVSVVLDALGAHSDQALQGNGPFTTAAAVAC